MRTRIWIMLLLPGAANLCLNAQTAATPVSAPRAVVVETFQLPPTSLSRHGNPGCSEAALAKARQNGLKFTDLPSIGSGLAKVGEREFVGITDRGPNGTATGSGDQATARRTFPLPQFCPAIVRFQLAAGHIKIMRSIPLSDGRGRLLSGLSNVEGEERLFESTTSAAPLPLDPDGVDPEAIRVLPDGRFLLSEENSPSILVVSSNGEVLVRYTPLTKPLTGATYPVKPILPAVFAQRRVNKGFENLALSPDGRFACAMLQSPMGDERDARFATSRVIRALKLDVSDPLKARVVGEYLLRASAARDYSTKQKQSKVSWSDAEWIAPDRLLVIERGKGEVKLLELDLTGATNVLNHAEEGRLRFEDASTDLAALGVAPAQTRLIFSTRDTPGITSDKLEGLAVLSPTDIALSNDNDFGIGDNDKGEPSMVWIVRLGEPLPLAERR